MRVLISGASGLVGGSLSDALSAEGTDVRRLVRSSAAPKQDTYPWNPHSGELDQSCFEGVDAVVHLSGENVATGRWSSAKKEKIESSRIKSTSLLAQAIAALHSPPPVFICASAVGFYGTSDSEPQTEESKKGEGFLAGVVSKWEEACEPLKGSGVRVVNLRIGLVLSELGGALYKMLFPFRCGLGGPLGDGAQYMSWITLEDLVRLILFSISSGGVSGPINAVTPFPVTNLEFTRTLGKVLRRPTVLPVPAPVLRLLLGEMAEELLLSSIRAQPKKALEAGFVFKHPGLEDALRSLHL